MKVLYLRSVFWFGLKSGGSVSHTAGVINALYKIADVHVVSNDELPGLKKKISILRPGILRFIPMRFGELIFSIKLIYQLREKLKHYDFIYQRYSGLSFAGVSLAKRLKVPLILEFNSSDVWMIKNWSKQKGVIKSILLIIANSIRLPIISFIENYNINNAFLIVVVSKYIKDDLVNKGIPEHKIIVNPNGVDPDIYSPTISGDNIRKKYQLQGCLVVGFIGTFDVFHGVLEMAKSINMFYANNPDIAHNVKFLLVGDGKLMPSAREIVLTSEYRNYVCFTGLIPQNDGPEYLSVCDILLSPHVENADGTTFFGSPTKLFEYMSMGKAIVASRLGQIGEILEHKKTALLVDPGNVTQLAEAMTFLIKNPGLRLEMGEMARKKILENFTWDKHVNRIINAVNKEMQTCL